MVWGSIFGSGPYFWFGALFLVWGSIFGFGLYFWFRASLFLVWGSIFGLGLYFWFGALFLVPGLSIFGLGLYFWFQAFLFLVLGFPIYGRVFCIFGAPPSGIGAPPIPGGLGGLSF